MKRLLCIVFMLLLLTGCGGNPAETTVPETTAAPTQPPVPWIEAVGQPWDEDGALTELPLTIPDALHFNAALEFDGDLLLWSIDSHLENNHTLELCLVELDEGTVAAQKEIPFAGTAIPQILADRLYLCDRYSGTILELNKNLETVNSWSLEPREATLTMGADEILYIYDWNGSVTRLDLKTGEETPVLEGDPYVDYFIVQEDHATIEYFSDEMGESMAVLDLMTGQLAHFPLEEDFSTVYYRNGIWLGDMYRDECISYVSTDSTNFLRAEIGYDSLRLLADGTILRIREDGCNISLHNPDGTAIAQALITAEAYNYTPTVLIPSERFGGYFVLITDYSSSMRLLHWDPAGGEVGEDIPFEPIPEPGEQEAAIRTRVKALESEYGVNILVGEDTETSFYDFSAEYVTDWELVEDALDTLEEALSDYPEGFFRQLRYDTIRSVDIHLVGNITATTAEYVHTYTAFVQYEYDRFTMGVDIFTADASTYYHEFSHVIDSFLEWDASQREDALFSEETWNSLNPDWFPGYSYDYSHELFLVDEESFIDSYSTIKPTEDRARVMEYAMVDYGQWYFEDKAVLQAKLHYYCRCIRDAFDTTGWPEDLLWEQYLS